MPTLLENYLSHSLPQGKKSSVVATLAALDYLAETHPEVARSILEELRAQRSSLKLIASENYCSLAVQLAMGNWLTDKYAEGYAGHRFYAGCENVDAVEDRATTLAKELFSAEYAYVQPHSGADTNLVALFSILILKVQSRELEKMGKKSIDALTKEEYETLRRVLFEQKIMGLDLSAGGHLTHGFRHNFSGKIFNATLYGVDPITHRIDYDQIAKMAKEVKPLVLIAGYSSYPRHIDFARMREIADSVGATFMVDMAHFAGLVAGKVFTGNHNPVPFAHIVTSTTHKTLRGPRGGFILAKKEFAEILNKGCPLILGGPLPHVMAAKAVAFEEALQPHFKNYAKQIVENASALGEALKSAGIKLVTDGTDNHLLVLDLTPLAITGRAAETALLDAGITVNRNMIPADPAGAWYTSGIRIGTPAITTLGMGREEMKIVAKSIATILKSIKKGEGEKGGEFNKAKGYVEPELTQKVKEEVRELLSRFTLYPEIPII